MASFTITPARGYIALEPSTRRGSLTVSVQNTSGIERELRATVAPEDEASGAWLRVREASQRARDREVVQFVVEAEAPPAAAEGSYGFTLRVAAEDDPDDVFAESQRLELQVPAGDGGGTDRTWWWVAAAAAVVVVVAVVVFLVARGGGDAPEVVLAGTSWELSSIGGDDPGAANVTATFDETTVSGSGGCNQYSADYLLTEDRLNVGDIQRTLRACINGDIAVIEGRYFDALRDARRVEVSGEAPARSLTVAGGDDELRFEEMPAP